MADEVIRIDTRIDTDSAERDLDELKKKLKNTSTEGKKGFNEAGKALDTADKSTKGLTVSMSALSKVLSGISAVAITKKVVDGIKDINVATEEAYSSLRKASTLFGDVNVDQQEMLKKLASIAAETGSSISELGEAMYQAMSAGVAPTEDMADVLDVVTKSAKLAKGGFTETSKAMSASLSVINAYKMNVSDIDKVQGILLQTQNKGVTTVNELGNALSKVTPAAAAFGVSFEQVASALALMTKQGTNTDVAATALATALSELGKSGTTASKNLKEAADAAGLSEDTFSGLLSEGYNLSEILTLMSDYAEQNGLSMVDMFGSIEAGRATLQLSGGNLEDFNGILASMGESAGLVQESFEKTISPADRLTSSFNALKVKMGNEFKPIVDTVYTSLANVMDKMVGQKGSAEDLDTAITNLNSALDNYATAQQVAKDKTDSTSLSMEIMAQDSVRTTLRTLGESWTAYNGYLESAQNKLAGFKDRMSEIDLALRQEAEFSLKRMGSNIDASTLTLRQAINAILTEMKNAPSGDGIWTYNDGTATRKKESILSLIQEYDSLSTSVDNAEESEKSFSEQMDSAAKTIAQFVVDGKLSMNDVYVYATGMYDAVEKAMSSLSKSTEEVKTAGEAAAIAGEQISVAAESTTSTVGMQSDELSEYIRRFGQINEEFNNLRNAGELLGESLYSPQDELETLKSLYVSWIKDVGQGSLVLDSLKKRIEELGGSVDSLNSSLEIEGFKTAVDETIGKFDKLSEASNILGDSYYSMESYLRDLEDLYANGLVDGIDASSDAMKNLADEIERIKGIIEKANDATVDWKGTWDDFRKQGYASLLKDISSAFDEIFQKESNLVKLEEELSDLAKKELDDKEAVEEAQSALDDATARGNAYAIDSAEEKLRKAKETLKATQNTIEAVNKEKKAVEDGSSVWKAFGNSAMQSMASVLESLGSSLAAQAAAALIGMNWGGAALATAGSLAAYAAASWARSQKFASGGIVGGTSYSGDNVIARVNSGELILNMAQQDNVAKALSTLADMSGLGTGQGGGVSVYLSGASFYGLDEPAVGKAIYDNIQQLHYEGVI